MVSRYSSILVLMFLLLTTACRQVHTETGLTGTIEGLVTDSVTNEPVVGASVIVKGTQMGTIADPEGHFTITKVPPGKYALVFLAVGYGRVEERGVKVKAGQSRFVRIALPQRAYDIWKVIECNRPAAGSIISSCRSGCEDAERRTSYPTSSSMSRRSR